MTEKTVREKKTTARRVFLDPSSPSVMSILRVVVITLLILSVADFAKNVISKLTFLFFMIILAVFFAYLIEPLIKIIQHPFEIRQREKLMPRPLAIVLAYVLVFSTVGFAITLLAPVVSEQAARFTSNLPAYTNSMQGWVSNIGNRFERYKIPENVQFEITGKFSSLIGEVGTIVTVIIFIAATYLPWLVLIPILSFFFLKDAKLFRLTLLKFFPGGRWRARAESFLQDVNTTIAAYTRAQLISCLLIGTICTIGFYMIGLNYAVLLGIIAGVLEFIPLIGPLTVGIIAVTTASFQSGADALYTFIFLTVLRIFHDYVSYPRIVRGGIHLHPLAIILSVLAGEQVAGIPGVFISIPVVALLTVLYKHIVEHSGSRGLFTGLFEENTESPKSLIIEKTEVRQELK